jgi:hypothetical protein
MESDKTTGAPTDDSNMVAEGTVTTPSASVQDEDTDTTDQGIGNNKPADVPAEPIASSTDEGRIAFSGDTSKTIPMVEPVAEVSTPFAADDMAESPTADEANIGDPLASDDAQLLGGIAVPAATMPASTTKKPKKAMVFGLIIAAAVVFLGGGAAAAYYQFVANSPTNVLQRTLANSFDDRKVKTVQFSGAVTVTEGSSTFEATYTGATDGQTGAFEASADVDVLLTKVKVDARSVDGKTFYIKVGGLSGLAGLLSVGDEAGMAAAYAPIIAAVNDQWIELNQSVAQQVTGSTLKADKLSEADRQKLYDAYKQHPFLSIKEKLADETIKGTKSYHYKVGIDAAALKAFAQAVKDAKIGSLTITDEELTGIVKSIDEAKLDATPLEVWIGKQDKLLSQLVVTAKDDQATMKLRFTVDSYNKEVKVEKPAGAKSILDMLSSVYTQDSTSALSALGSGISL